MFDVMLERAAPGSGKTALDLPDERVRRSRSVRGWSRGPVRALPVSCGRRWPRLTSTERSSSTRCAAGEAGPQSIRSWDDAPTTSEQILHPEKWLAHEAARTVARRPTFAKPWGKDWQGRRRRLRRGARRDSHRAFPRKWMAPKMAAADASSRLGRRSQGVLARRTATRAAFAWSTPSTTLARRSRPNGRGPRVRLRSTRALDTSLGAGPGDATPAVSVARERRPRVRSAVARVRGRQLVFVMGPARTTAGAWASAGDCNLARQWAHEIAGTK